MTATRDDSAAGHAEPPPLARDEPFGFATRAVHSGARPDPVTGSRNVPIHQTTSYVFEDADHAAALFNLQTFGYIYSRLTNPTVAALEERVAALEGGRAAVAAASGHAAQLLAFYTLLEPGDHVVAARQLYGGSLTQLRHTFRRLGWRASFVDATDPDAIAAAIESTTKAVFVESLANPGGVVVDLESVADVAHAAAIPLIVDNTLATPYLCRPFEWGADLVVHSLTKFLSGHGTSMGGVLVESGRFDWRGSGKFPFLAGPDEAYHGLDFIETFGDFGFTTKARAVALRDLGPALSPTNAFHILTGIETLPLRMDRHVANALAVAEHLATHPSVAWVSYAGLPSNPSHELARRYLPRGAGSVFTFGVRGGYEAGIRVVESVDLWSHLANVGDTRSLILHPASTTHRQLSDGDRLAAGAGPDVVRLSVGIEDVADLIADLDQALAAAAS
jgi:O-acetylhomoserine (thiol)-lyase